MQKDERNVNNIRVMGAEVVANAKSGHTGIVLSAAPILYTLYAKHLNFSSKDPDNILRDRFVLSAGHGSALLYTVLHMFGFNISKDDLLNFRKINSVTSGHPELNAKLGIECTTGPLGQGVATAVGMAIGAKKLKEFNKNNCQLFDNTIYTLVGDGCLMEGVSFEALSLAGTLNLDNLVVLYDSNNNTLDSSTENTMQIDMKKYVESLGFEYFYVKNGNSVAQIDKAIAKAKKSKKPAFVEIKTILGFASEKEGSYSAHGLVMNEDQISGLKKKLNINTGFLEVLDSVKVDIDKILSKNNNDIVWQNKLNYYKQNYPKDYEKLCKIVNGDIESIRLNDIKLDKESESTRNISALVLEKLAEKNENILCGNADLSSCTKAVINNSGNITSQDFSGRNLMYGVREFAMACISNGLSLMGYKVLAGTFMVFSDYMRSAIRSSALMKLPVTYILSHDSIAVGEDGPTHQPIEQIDSYRIMPNVNMYRPCNVEETAVCYSLALKSKNTPSVLSLTRQPVAQVKTPKDELANISKGAYIISKEDGALNTIIIATGSEVSLAFELKKLMNKKGVRIVSVPCLEVYEKQSSQYKNKLLPNEVSKRIIIEASSCKTLGCLAGEKGKIFGIDNFGVSAPMAEVQAFFELTAKDILSKI